LINILRIRLPKTKQQDFYKLILDLLSDVKDVDLCVNNEKKNKRVIFFRFVDRLTTSWRKIGEFTYNLLLSKQFCCRGV